ncbi:hypothetical protein RR46_10753 [Papilio xuthus]|uniref:Uncharacterized protein n=1 Tax=Papilio xuthus TaxID=66420 RepID=A0A194PKF9_PAPXU|nr:hypothetical protein RR46_10753 [Papilio xuthus]
MEPRSKLRKVIFFCLLLSLFGMVAFGYFCPDQGAYLTEARSRGLSTPLIKEGGSHASGFHLFLPSQPAPARQKASPPGTPSAHRPCA